MKMLANMLGVMMVGDKDDDGDDYCNNVNSEDVHIGRDVRFHGGMDGVYGNGDYVDDGDRDDTMTIVMG